MAKASDAAICMFCDKAPCECNKPKKAVKPRKAAAPKKTEVPVAPPEEDFFADEKIPEAKKVFKAKEPERNLDLSLLSALSAVREIVTPLERRRINAEISTAFEYSQATDKRIQKLKETLDRRRRS